MTDGQKSFWGWGWADRFPDKATRRQFAGQVQGLRGIKALEAHEPPTLASIQLPDNRFEPPTSLSAFVSSSPTERVTHTYGRSFRGHCRVWRHHSPPPRRWPHSPALVR